MMLTTRNGKHKCVDFSRTFDREHGKKRVLDRSRAFGSGFSARNMGK